MAVEKYRGCGYRHVGGMYLVGDYIPVECDRLPYKLDACPVCGAGIKVGRGMTKINPLLLFGWHDDCHDKVRYCFICDPYEEPAYLMNVGARFYPTCADFINEGIAQGFSKRIAQIPKEFEVGKTIIYLTHPKACVIPESETETEPNNEYPLLKEKNAMGIFTAFIPQRIEKLYWQSELDNMTDKVKIMLERRGITPIGIPNGDLDHV